MHLPFSLQALSLLQPRKRYRRRQCQRCSKKLIDPDDLLRSALNLKNSKVLRCHYARDCLGGQVFKSHLPRRRRPHVIRNLPL
jgi:hypothetical protein